MQLDTGPGAVALGFVGERPHPQGRTAMHRTEQRRQPRQRPGGERSAGRCGYPHREGRGVQLVVGHQHQRGAHRSARLASTPRLGQPSGSNASSVRSASSGGHQRQRRRSIGGERPGATLRRVGRLPGRQGRRRGFDRHGIVGTAPYERRRHGPPHSAAASSRGRAPPHRIGRDQTAGRGTVEIAVSTARQAMALSATSVARRPRPPLPQRLRRRRRDRGCGAGRRDRRHPPGRG